MPDVLRVLLMRLGTVLLAATVTAVGCGDDSYIATNEIQDLDATTGKSGESGSGGETGSSGSAGASVGGSAGAASCTPGDTENVGTCEKCGTASRVCDANGVWGAPVCEPVGVCEVGDVESQPCGNCGTQTRTCQSDCTWGAFEACSGEGACQPGAIDSNCMSGPSGGQKLDPCLQKECNANCQWSACKLKPGAVCAWEAGTNFKCCGTDMWQYCSGGGSNVCNWHPCASCNGCSAC